MIIKKLIFKLRNLWDGGSLSKYYIDELDSITYHDEKLYRIVACRNFGEISNGELGGYISLDSKLSQKGNCWIHDGSFVTGKCKISGNVQIYKSTLHHFVKVKGDGIIKDSKISYFSKIKGKGIEILDLLVSEYVIIKGDNIHIKKSVLNGLLCIGENTYIDSISLDGDNNIIKGPITIKKN